MYYLALRSSVPRACQSSALTSALRRAGKTITIVSNNSVAAILAYLDAHDLAPLITGVVGRSNPSPALLKPHPTSCNRPSARRAHASECVLIGDSTTDIEAARAARTAVIAYGNKPGKQDRFAPLQPDATITTMSDLTVAAAVT